MQSYPRLRSFLSCALAAVSLFLAGCEFEVPLTMKPGHPIDEKLLGRWSSPDGWAKLSRYDAQNFVLIYNGAVYRAWHTPAAGLDLLTLQNLESETPKYYFLNYTWSGNGKDRLDVRFVSEEPLGKNIKDSETLRRAIEQNTKNPALLHGRVPFARIE